MGKSLDTYSHHGATWYTPASVQIFRKLGHRGIHPPFIGAVAPGLDPIMVRRIMVEGSFDLDAFWANLRPLPNLQRKLISHLKKLPPRILGPRLRLPIRSCLFESRLAPSLTLRGLKVLLSLAQVVIALLVLWLIW